MNLSAQATTLATVWLAICCGSAALAATPLGTWEAELETPGGALRFGLELTQDGSQWQAQLANGPERIEVPRVSVEGEQVVVEMTHYDSRIDATYNAGNDTLDGHLDQTPRCRQTSNVEVFGSATATPSPTTATPRTISGQMAREFLVRQPTVRRHFPARRSRDNCGVPF